ncbi:hypothetical protein ADZ37_23085 [Pannonibacter phragmitetus]|uniref:Uncharacterized protein n=1 Tax=Pannonibacter phragmitetus TaxID=121719 RepID=A0A0L0ISA0_9HYPH|nr:hypothetical protein [Pannonibacter phragmitetus]ALV27046.1 hypothetical protein APZ00_08160 [Pannonibacter phragmitetus]KND16426.1 hypothetical protein ADZ37_23085 [Pannonibacter phragmitetus]MBA4205606.1 hypothetical protein [Polymorphum sp.]
MGERERRAKAREDEARRALSRVQAESETILGSATSRMASHAQRHFGAADKNQNDRIEVWGTRIGRMAGLLFAAGLVIYLVSAYLM